MNPQTPGVDPDDVATVFRVVTTAVTGELAAVRRLLDALDQVDRHGPHIGLSDEWQIAADGLFGPTGVLGSIAEDLAGDRPARSVLSGRAGSPPR